VIVQADAYAINDARVGLELVFAPLSAGADGEPDRLIGLYQPPHCWPGWRAARCTD
jgi:hypothetical protein